MLNRVPFLKFKFRVGDLKTSQRNSFYASVKVGEFPDASQRHMVDAIQVKTKTTDKAIEPSLGAKNW